MTVKKGFKKIEYYYHFCEFCKKRMNHAYAPDERQGHDYTGRYMDDKFINTSKNDIHIDCLEKLLKEFTN